tara:strand:+ start:598 stop:741 length:144 start_codon:yes stop_codon:yes gene_type:complete
MPKQSFGQLYFDMKESIKLQKKKSIYEKRKKLLKDNLKKRKKINRLD